LFVEVSKDIQLCKLPYLTALSAWRKSCVNTKHLQRLLEVSPNLYHLKVNFDFLQPLFDDESVCLLLQQRITHLYILLSLSESLEPVISSMPRLISTFSSLKHFYFCLEKGCQPSEPLILSTLSYITKCNSLISFGVVNAVMTQEILSKDIQQWVMEHSTLHDHNSFIVDYTDEIFRLWL
jgi:hypothetical protein